MAAKRDQASAVRVVERALASAGQSQQWLISAADIDSGTLTDFLAGTRWPHLSTRGRIERALRLAPNSLGEVAEGSLTVDAALAPVAAADVPESTRSARPVGLGLDDAAEGLTDSEIEVVRATILAIKGERRG